MSKNTNNAKVVLDNETPISETTTSIPLPTGKGGLFGNQYPYYVTYEYRNSNNIVIEREIMRVNSRSGDTLNVSRKNQSCPQSDTANSQTKIAFKLKKGGVIENRITAEWMNDFNGEDNLVRTNIINTLLYDLLVKGNIEVDASSVGAKIYGMSGSEIWAIERTNEYSNGDIEMSGWAGISMKVNKGGTSKKVYRLGTDGSMTFYDGVVKSSQPHIQASLLNGWLHYGGSYGYLNYYKTPDGTVYIQGLIKGGTIQSPAFVLPVGMRPPRSLMATTTSNNSSDLLSRVIIYTSGNVIPHTGGTSWFAINTSFNIYA